MNDPTHAKPGAQPTRAPSRLPLGWCAAVFLIALLLRGGWGIAQMARAGDPAALTFPDEQWYWRMAKTLHDGGGLVGEFGHRAGRMPLYPALLSFAADADHGVICVRAVQWIVGSLAAILGGLLAADLAGRRAGVIAAALVACDPGLVGAANLLLTETLFVTVVAAWWWVGWPLSRPRMHGAVVCRAGVVRWALAAVLASACVYTRPVGVGLVILWVGFVLVRRRFAARALLGCLAVLLIVVLSLVPWGVRNSRETGQWCWLTTRAGISLYDGVRPGATGAGDLADVKNAPDVRGLTEHEWNRHFLDAALGEMRSDPRRVARLGLAKLTRTWSPWLHADEVSNPVIRSVFAGWTIVFYLLVVVGVVSRRREPALWSGLLLPSLLVCMVHLFYVGSMRYRLGAVTTLAVLAGIGACHALAAWTVRRQRQQ